MQTHTQNISAPSYSFGMNLPDRVWTSDSAEYDFGFGGQMKDDEVYGEGNSYTAEYWQYDSRLGRRWNVDPRDVPSFSPYSCFANNPVWFSDVYGDSATSTPDDGQYVTAPNGQSVLVGAGGVQSSDGNYLVYYSSQAVYKWDSEGGVYLPAKQPIVVGSSEKNGEEEENSEEGNSIGFNAFVINLASVDHGFRHDSYNQNIGDELRFAMFEGYRAKRMELFLDVAWNNPGTQGLLWITPTAGLTRLGLGVASRIAGRRLGYSLAVKGSGNAFRYVSQG